MVNLSSNAASLLVFVITARVDYGIAAAMIAGQLIGGRLGAGMAIRHGAPFIRVAFIAVVIAMVAKLLSSQGADPRAVLQPPDPNLPKPPDENLPVPRRRWGQTMVSQRWGQARMARDQRGWS